MVVAKVYKLAKPFNGLPTDGDFKLAEEKLPPLKDGEFLAEAVFLSVDPYMRAYVSQVNATFIGSQVARIIESNDPDFPVGQYVVGHFGWRTHTIASKSSTDDLYDLPPLLLPNFGTLPLSLGLGALGMPGNTAYFGFLEICYPKEGETVVVSGAGGAVGTHVGQIAKIKGCKVIGIAGSDEKGKWITKELGFDHFINYKTQDVAKTLKQIAPQGIDCYFDNVGGEISSTVLQQMNKFGRISVCGCISSYNEKSLPKATIVQPAVLFKQLEMKGFIVYRWINRWNEGIKQNLQWINEGKIKYRETVTEGFENTPKAFRAMLEGDNYGKAVVKV